MFLLVLGTCICILKDMCNKSLRGFLESWKDSIMSMWVHYRAACLVVDNVSCPQHRKLRRETVQPVYLALIPVRVSRP